MFPEDLTLQNLNALGKGNMLEHLGIEMTEFGEDFLKAKMPVDHRTKQPMGLLHGGASVVLAETLGSVASTLVVDIKKYAPVGLEVNANHIKAAKEGFVHGKVSPVHIGKKTHVWQIEIKNDENELVSVARLTTAIIERR